MEWKFEADRPVYIQLIEQIKLRIITGVYPAGQRLPAVRELAADAAVNPNTMQRAFTELESSGLIVTQRTAGRFITDDPKAIEAARRGLLEETAKGFLERMKLYGCTREETMKILNETAVYDTAADNGGISI